MAASWFPSSGSRLRAESDKNLDSSSSSLKPAPMVRVAGLPEMLPTALFAFIFHHSIPTLAEPARDKDSIGQALAWTVWLIVMAYLLISIPAVLYFGKDTLPAASLNWNTYKPTYWGALADFVRGWVVFFPAISLVSTYPLMCITLANQLESMGEQYFGHRPRYFYRLFAAVPPLTLAAAMNDLGLVTSLAGVCGFVVTLVFPVKLQRGSRRKCDEIFGPGHSDTVHTTWFTSQPRAVAILGLLGAVLTASLGLGLIYELVIEPFIVVVNEHGNWA